MSPIGLQPNPLMPSTGQQAPMPAAVQPPPATVPGNPLATGAQQQPSQLPPPPQPAPSPALIKTAIGAGKIVLSELTQIANDPVLMSDPDKLQKALLGLAADAHRAAGRDAPPVASSLAQVMSIMSDPRGPKLAIRDKIAVALQHLSQLDSYSRQKHGQPGLQPPDTGGA